jgi:MOSC domain-containing protein YiiM
MAPARQAGDRLSQDQETWAASAPTGHDFVVFQGRLVAIYTAGEAGGPMQGRDAVRAVVGVGIDGDRYAAKEGTFSQTRGTGREVTLVEREAVAGARKEYGIELDESETRRNLVTEGVPLNHLVGRTFRVGEVVLRGVRLNEPCAHLEKLTRSGVRKALVHRGGLRADIVRGGTLRVGDPVVEATQ